MTDDVPRDAADALRALDPVPDPVLAAARAAYARRLPGALLAEPAEASPLPGVRAADTARRLAFAAPDVAIEIEVLDRDLAGRLLPAAPARVTARRADGATHPGRTDDAGRFAFTDLAPGPLSLAFERPDGSTVVTSWIRI
ncbi:carboxypeptidase-like regulatory domain-containing protein [Actinomadura atramentaria]|uniref:carboxypeptidase-like regulatory domain-containing protein n=1 Tax=Actinomadura atramentaria TaxID=1990 RepID=UPI00037918E7|nr:carboxypeptidase-like regulatory domain-containing protein [Actinomadura atramentaria]